MGILDVLIPLTASSSVEVAGNAAAALGNLSSKADDYSAFVAVWQDPAGGLEGYLARFLQSDDTTFAHIAVWTAVQLLESGDQAIDSAIRNSTTLLPLIQRLAHEGADGTAGESTDAGGSDGDPEDLDGGDGAAEIRALAASALQLIADDVHSAAGHSAVS